MLAHTRPYSPTLAHTRPVSPHTRPILATYSPHTRPIPAHTRPIPAAALTPLARPQVIYNNKTRKYVMWFHLDNSNYSYRHAAIATADKPQGPFTYLYSFQPDNIPSLDMNLFLDPIDGEVRLVSPPALRRPLLDCASRAGVVFRHPPPAGLHRSELAVLSTN